MTGALPRSRSDASDVALLASLAIGVRHSGRPEALEEEEDDHFSMGLPERSRALNQVQQHRVELIFPERPASQPTLLDRMRTVFGTAIAMLGFFLLIAAGAGFIGNFAGLVTVSVETVQSCLMTGMIMALGGVHLASQSASFVTIRV